MNAIDPIAHVGPVDDSSSASPSLTLLRVSGADAVMFLDAQLTRNVPPAGAASLAGYCSPKGRLLACFVIWRCPDGSVGLLLASAIAEPVVKRLRMYVMRAKVTIEAVRDGTAIEGRWATPESTTTPVWGVDIRKDVASIRYPDADGRSRSLRIGPAAASDSGIDDATWHWLNVRAGLPSIGATTQDRFVPQMLNLEALGGVDFRKGCFPGQEVVARSQYLGKLKRRMALATIVGTDVPAPATDVWSAAGADPVGMVVDAAVGPDGRIAALIELPVALFDAVDLRVGSREGPTLALEPLPYALPDNEVFVRPKL